MSLPITSFIVSRSGVNVITNPTSADLYVERDWSLCGRELNRGGLLWQQIV